jgi:hypothetical protein
VPNILKRPFLSLLLATAFLFIATGLNAEKVSIFNDVGGTLYLDQEAIGRIGVNVDLPYVLPGVSAGSHLLRLSLDSGMEIRRELAVVGGQDQVAHLMQAGAESPAQGSSGPPQGNPGPPQADQSAPAVAAPEAEEPSAPVPVAPTVAADQVAALSAAAPGPFRRSWYLRADTGMVALSTDDLKKFEDGGQASSISGPSVGSGYTVGLAGGYGFRNGFGLECGLQLGPLRDSNSTGIGDAESLSLTEFSTLSGISFQFPYGGQFIFGARLLAGPSWLYGSYSASVTAPYAEGPGSAGGGYDLWSVAAMESVSVYMLWLTNPHFALGAELGYRSCSFEPVLGYSDNINTVVQNPLTYADGTFASFDDSGFFLRLNISYFIEPVLAGSGS